MICVSKRSRNRFPPEREACWGRTGVSGASRGEFGSRAGLWHEAEPRAERWRREIYCKVQHLSSAVQRPPPDSDPVNLFRSDSFKHAALRAAVQHTWRTVHTTERPSAKQPVTRPNIFLDTICYIFSSLWTQSFPHENFPIHSFIRLSEHTFPHFCTHKSECLLSCFHILDRMGFFVFVFLKHNNEHLEAAGIVWVQPVMPLLTPETHVWY